jgi:glycosyltransferase involved in cell wall biosynthesis
MPPREKGRPTVSVITPSLNHGKFLEDTIQSVLQQTFTDCEHIVVDGGSTDDTLDILKRHAHLRWISEKETDENTILEAYRKAIAMARGHYVIQCCLSDGFLDKNWFKYCVEILDADKEISLVWGLAQRMTEEGHMEKIRGAEFLDKAPPQKKDFLAYWFAYGMGFPEFNYMIRRDVLDNCFPQRHCTEPMSVNPAWTFIYKFNTSGYLPYFLPIIANYTRHHADQRGTRLNEIEDPASHRYIEMMKNYRRSLFRGKTHHRFRDGDSEVIGYLNTSDVRSVRTAFFHHYIKYKIRKRLTEILGKL